MSEWKTAGKVRMTPKGVYSSSTAYEILDIVSSTDKLISYIAKKAVPAGTALTNTEYWAVLNDISEAAANVNNGIQYIAPAETSPSASAHSVGEYIIYDGNLYSVIDDISIGDELVADTNVTLITGGFTNDLSDNVIKAQSTQPTEVSNKVWFDTDSDEEITVPTYEEFEDLKSTIDATNRSIKDVAVPMPVSGDWENGSIDGTNGTPQPTGKTIRTKYFYPISNVGNLTFTGVTSNGRVRFSCFYDKNYNFIGRMETGTDDIPVDSCFVKFVYGFVSSSSQTVDSYGKGNLIADWSISYDSEVSLIKSAVENVAESMIANNDGLDFWGAEGETSQSGLTVTQHGTIVTINGVYTASARRRFNLSGNLENSASATPVEWYATVKAPMENGANYRLSVKPISGSINIPSGNTNPAFNLQAYTTSGYLGLDAYVYADRISNTVITSDGTPLGCVLLTCNKDFVFVNYRFSVELLKIDVKDETVYVDTTNGSDTNTGTKSYPLKTIGKALSCGYRKLRVAPGVYNEKIAINGGDLEIIKTDNSESYSDQFRKKIELINGTKLTVSASGTTNIYQASYTAESGSNIYEVFVSHTVTPTTQGSLSLEYNAMLIGDKPNNAGGNNKQRLYLPVLTENELSDQGTFWYDGTNHLIKFHPWNNVQDDAYYVPADSADTIIDLTNMGSVRLEDVRIVGAYNNCAYIKKSDNVTVTACEFGLCGKGMGLRLDNTNASVIDCHAFGCAVDGFNLHEYGHSVFYGCTGFYCGDDGISHHQGCTGIIDGGEWAYNGRGSGNGGGISPTFGSIIETRNVYSHDNHLGIMQEGTSGKRRAIRWSNNVVVDNDTDFYIQYYDVVAWNCVYKTKNVLNYGTLTEYNNTILT